MTKIRIIDPHIHLWDPYTTPRAVSGLVKTLGRWPKVTDVATRLLMPKSAINFVGKADYVLNKHLPETFHQDTGKYKIEGYVHIQAGWESKNPLDLVEETKWLEQLSQRPLGIIGQVHLHQLDHLEEVLLAHAKSKRFKGVRDMIAMHDSKSIMDFSEVKNALVNKEFQKGYQKLGEKGLTYDAFLYAHQLKDFTTLVKSYPETKVVLDHMGTPVAIGGPHGKLGHSKEERASAYRKWQEDMIELSEVSHVKVKLSGFLMPVLGFGFEKRKSLANLNEVVDAIGPSTEFVLNTFGVDRCMFASNFPMDKVSTTYENLYDAYFKIVSSYSKENKQRLFANNAIDFYNLDIHKF